MIATDIRTSLLHRLDEVRRLCPEMRLGQMLATLELLGQDATGRSLWDIEDDELAMALERFADDLTRRTRAWPRGGTMGDPRPRSALFFGRST